MRFQAVLELSGKTATGMRVPASIVEQLGGGRRPAVRVTIKGYTYRSTVAVYGGEYLLGVNADNRAAAGVQAGVLLDVDIELDTAPREVTVPEDFATALEPFPEARRFFDGLSYSERRWFVLGIEDAKTTQTRTRRIEKGVARLREGRGQR
ncbi:MAG: DUF1905 domain-containing protein [Chloroflexi bacterium]|nr:DUF1905 domain-containing protein [Chloroflexota bacterium]